MNSGYAIQVVNLLPKHASRQRIVAVMALLSRILEKFVMMVQKMVHTPAAITVAPALAYSAATVLFSRKSFVIWAMLTAIITPAPRLRPLIHAIAPVQALVRIAATNFPMVRNLATAILSLAIECAKKQINLMSKTPLTRFVILPWIVQTMKNVCRQPAPRRCVKIRPIPHFRVV